MNNLLMILFGRMKVLWMFAYFCGISFNLSAQQELLKESYQNARSTYIPDSIIKYANISADLAQQLKMPELKAEALIMVARAYAGKGDYQQAKSSLDKANKIIRFMHIDSLESDALLETGSLNQLRKDYKIAEEAFINGLALAEKTESPARIAKANIYLAEYYRHVGKFSKADEHIQKAYKISKEHSIPATIVISAYNRYAAIKSETNQPDSSLYYSNLALEMARKTDNKHYIAISLNEIGYVHENQNRLKEAEQFYIKALDIWDSIGVKDNLTNVISNLGRIYTKMKRFNQSNETLEKLVGIGKEQKSNYVLLQAYSQLYDNYAAMGNCTESLKYLDLKYQVSLEINKENYEKEVHRLSEKIQSNVEKEPEESVDKKTAGEEKGAIRWFKFIILFLAFVIVILVILVIKQRKRS